MSNVTDWRQELEQMNQEMHALMERGICYVCHDLQTGAVLGTSSMIHEDDVVKVYLVKYPQVIGHTVVLYKPHRMDISELTDDDAGLVFPMCLRVVRALKQALGAEKVYVLTQCDWSINHFHLHLYPRYPGELVGNQRLVLDRQPVIPDTRMVERIRAALDVSGRAARGDPAAVDAAG